MSRGDAGNRTDLIIKQLGLEPHPERGFYRQTYRASLDVPSSTHGAARAASTAIYFLVTASEPDTYLHRLKSDEIFHLYDGGPLDILRLFPDGAWDVARLGMDLAAGERPQIVIPAGTWSPRPSSSGPRIAWSAAPSHQGSTSRISSWRQGPIWRRATRKPRLASSE